jgi:hypothetical protein
VAPNRSRRPDSDRSASPPAAPAGPRTATPAPECAGRLPEGWTAPPGPRRRLTPADERLLRALYLITRHTPGNPRTRRVLADAIRTHLLTGTRVEDLAALLGISAPQIRNIHRAHPDYTPPTDSGTPRQLG